MDMKKIIVYLLVHDMDTEYNWGSNVSTHTSHESAFNEMVSQWSQAIEDYKYCGSGHGDEDECICTINSATIRMFDDIERWRIEVHAIKPPEEN